LDSVWSATCGLQSQGIAGVCLSLSLIVGTVAMPGGWDALATGCGLKMTLTVKDTQDGFAGTTGTVWTIGLDCTFRVSRVFGPQVAEPHRTGRLTPEHEARLSAPWPRPRRRSCRRSWRDDPGERAPATLEYGGTISVLSLSPAIAPWTRPSAAR
jgi:hypothetical protein